MGGDHGPSVVVPASLLALKQHENLRLILVGDRQVLEKTLGTSVPDRLQIQHASQQVEMDELPAHALRFKKDSSMRLAINLVKERKADACISAGNTGALMATGHFVLKTIPGIDRPAIISTFPTLKINRNMRMLDLGANVDSSAETLFQFAVMGSVLASALDNIDQPKVCLLNIGEEAIKGNEQVKKTAQLLTNANIINYAGFVEGDQIYHGDVDVVVCDGFVGNVTLKTSEGAVIFLSKVMKGAFQKNIFTKLAALIAMPVIKSIIRRFDPDRYNGASLIGLRGIVIKSHGGAKAVAFNHAIQQAIIQVEKDIPQQINTKIEQLLKLNINQKE